MVRSTSAFGSFSSSRGGLVLAPGDTVLQDMAGQLDHIISRPVSVPAGDLLFPVAGPTCHKIWLVTYLIKVRIVLESGLSFAGAISMAG